MVGEHVGKQSKTSSKAPAKGKKAASPKKQSSKSAKQAASGAKEAASDLEVGLSDAEEQNQQTSSSLEDAGTLGGPLTYSCNVLLHRRKAAYATPAVVIGRQLSATQPTCASSASPCTDVCHKLELCPEKHCFHKNDVIAFESVHKQRLHMWPLCLAHFCHFA